MFRVEVSWRGVEGVYQVPEDPKITALEILLVNMIQRNSIELTDKIKNFWRENKMESEE